MLGQCNSSVMEGTLVAAPAGTSRIALDRRRCLLSELPVFDAEDAGLQELAEALEEETVTAGAVIFSEGDAADALYLIAQGEARLSAQGRWAPVSLATLGPGEMVGERGLVFPGSVRNATLTAHTDLTLLVLSRRDFERFVGSSEERRAAFEDYAEELLAARFLRDVGPFASLDNRQRRALAARLGRRRVATGKEIVVQGEEGAACYMIRSGAAEVLVSDDRGGERRIAMVGAGDLIGEAALLTGNPRSATVRATEPCELLELRSSDLRELAGSATDVAADLTYLIRLRSRPRQAHGIVTAEAADREAEKTLTLHNPERRTYFRLTPRGRFLWDRLDGTRTLKDLTLEYHEAFGGLEPRVVAEIVVGLARAGMTDDEGLAKVSLTGGVKPTRAKRFLRLARRLMFRAYRIESADRWLSALHRYGGRLLATAPAKAVLGVIALGGLLAFGYGALEGSQGLARDPQLLAFVLPGILFSTLVHEIAHGLAVKAYGRAVPNGGIGLLWLRPVAFVDTSEMWLGSRRERIMVSLGGPFSGLVLSGILATAAIAVSNDQVATVLWAMCVPILTGVAINMSPFIELDGYHALCDLLDRPNLRADSVAWTRNWLRGGRARDVAVNRLYLGYASASLAYMLALVVIALVHFRVLLEHWLIGLVGKMPAETLAWVMIVPSVVLMLAAIVDEYASLWRARAGGAKPA